MNRKYIISGIEAAIDGTPSVYLSLVESEEYERRRENNNQRHHIPLTLQRQTNGLQVDLIEYQRAGYRVGDSITVEICRDERSAG